MSPGIFHQLQLQDRWIIRFPSKMFVQSNITVHSLIVVIHVNYIINIRDLNLVDYSVLHLALAYSIFFSSFFLT